MKGGARPLPISITSGGILQQEIADAQSLARAYDMELPKYAYFRYNMDLGAGAGAGQAFER